MLSDPNLVVGTGTVMFSMVPIALLIVALALGLLVATTKIGVARLEAEHPPTGQFVDVHGTRIHVAELGLDRDAPGAEPAVVLIHGASGNLEDMRLALGEKLALSRPRRQRKKVKVLSNSNT
jgi:hypothetical protein